MKKFRMLLLSWHRKNSRSFPWRKDPDPYRIMIAEFMLQRTRAEQVVPVYNAFLEVYPDIDALSRSNIKDIREILKPLGLYWRASHFQKAAKYIVNYYNGEIPDNRDELLKIPGIGEYAAGAILAVAFSRKTEVVDSNIARVLNRYYGFGLEGEIRRKREIVELSRQLFNSKIPRKVLFAIIDFSAIICTPQNPKHELCIVKQDCEFYKKIKKNG